jgi:hypothetical protein
MKVDSVKTILGWEENRRISEVRTTCHYSKSKSVTTVNRISEECIVYTSNGLPSQSKSLGSSLDIIV